MFTSEPITIRCDLLSQVNRELLPAVFFNHSNATFECLTRLSKLVRRCFASLSTAARSLVSSCCHLAAIRLTLPWMVGFSSYVLCAVVAAHAMRLEKARNQPPLLRDVAASVTQRVSEAVRPGIRSRTILLLSISEGLRSAARKSYWQEWPRYFTTHLHSRIAAIGYFYCAFSIAG